MKKTILFLTACLFLASSCSKDDVATNAATNDEAAEIIASALASDDGGAIRFIESTSDIAGNLSSNFKSTEVTLKDTIIADSLKSNTSARQFKFEWDYTLKMVKDNYTIPGTSTVFEVPASLVSSHTYTGEYDGPYYGSTHKGEGSSTFTDLYSINGLSFSINSIWNMSGTYKRNAIRTNKINQRVITCDTEISFTNVKVDRTATYKIQSGTGIITCAGNVSGKGDFSYTGTITFNGNGAATIYVNKKSYSIILSSGATTAN